MAEYIDRGAFLEHMKKTNRYFDVKHDIENFPTADVAPVVRCKDCKYLVSVNANGKGVPTCQLSGMEVAPKDYCSYAEGKRKESDT